MIEYAEHSNGLFTYFPSGFEIALQDGKCFVDWAGIESVHVYKEDVMTMDVVCMEIEFDKRTLLITEETPGWRKFTDTLSSMLVLNNENWEEDVIFPPFKANAAVIYQKEIH